MPQWQSPVPVAKASPYDRNPTQRLFGVNFVATTHVPSLQVSYTIPAGRAAFLDVIFANLRRATAAGALGSVYIQFVYSTAAGASQTIMILYFLNNTLLAATSPTLTAFGFLKAGDNLSIYTANGDTGGTCEFNASMKGTEYEY